MNDLPQRHSARVTTIPFQVSVHYAMHSVPLFEMLISYLFTTNVIRLPRSTFPSLHYIPRVYQLATYEQSDSERLLLIYADAINVATHCGVFSLPTAVVPRKLRNVLVFLIILQVAVR